MLFRENIIAERLSEETFLCKTLGKLTNFMGNAGKHFFSPMGTKTNKQRNKQKKP